MRFVPGPDLPTGGTIVGLEGIRDAYETGRGAFRTRAKARIETVTPRRKGIVVTELPYSVGPRAGHREDQGAGPGQEAAGHRRRQGPHRPRARAAPRHRDQDRLRPRGRARAALPADADGGLVRHQQRGARRRRAAHARARELLRVYVEHRLEVVRRRRSSAWRKARGATAPGRGPAHRDPRHRRGHPGHPHLRRPGAGARAADDGLRPERDPGQLHPRHAAAPADRFSRLELERGARRAARARSPS